MPGGWQHLVCLLFLKGLFSWRLLFPNNTEFLHWSLRLHPHAVYLSLASGVSV